MNNLKLNDEVKNKVNLTKKQLSKLKDFEKKKDVKQFLDNHEGLTDEELDKLKRIEFSDETILNNLKYDKCLDDNYDLTDMVKKYRKKNDILETLSKSKVNLALFYYGNIDDIYLFLKPICISNNSNNTFIIKFSEIVNSNNDKLLLDYVHIYSLFKIFTSDGKQFDEVSSKNRLFDSDYLESFKTQFRDDISTTMSMDNNNNDLNYQFDYYSNNNNNGNSGWTQYNNSANGNSGSTSSSNGNYGSSSSSNGNSGSSSSANGNNESHKLVSELLTGGNDYLSLKHKSKNNSAKCITELKKLLMNSVIEINDINLADFPRLKQFVYEKQFALMSSKITYKSQYVKVIKDINTLGDLEEYICYYGIHKDIKIPLYKKYNNILRDGIIKNNIMILLKHKLDFLKIFYILKNLNTRSVTDYISSLMKEVKEIFKYYYLYNLTFIYETHGISIHPSEMINATCKTVNKYFDLFENILIDIVENKTVEYNNVEEHIKTVFKSKLKNMFESGFCTSTVYNFNSKTEYNLPLKFIKNIKHYHDIKYILNINSVQKGIYYFDNVKKKIVCIKNNSILDYLNSIDDKSLYTDDILKNIRPILCRKQLTRMKKVYKTNCLMNLSILQQNIEQYVVEQSKLNYVYDILKHSYNKKVIRDYHKYVQKKITTIFLNSETNEVILTQAKNHFKKIVKELHSELMMITRTKDKDVLYSYNLFLDKYVIWLIAIITHMINFSNNSKQKLIFNKIFEMFLDKKHILKWSEKCKKNNLNYYIPIKSKSPNKKTITSRIGLTQAKPVASTIQYYNLTTGKKEDKLSKFDYTVVGIHDSSLSTDEFHCWTGSIDDLDIHNLIIYYMKHLDSYEVKDDIQCSMENITNQILVEKKRVLENSNNDINTLNRKMESINRQITEYESSSSQCKYLISYEQLLKEILKVKYPLKISNVNNNTSRNTSLLNSKVREYQNELMAIIS